MKNAPWGIFVVDDLFQKFPLESDDSVLSSTLKQFSSYLDDVSRSEIWQIFKVFNNIYIIIHKGILSYAQNDLFEKKNFLISIKQIQWINENWSSTKRMVMNAYLMIVHLWPSLLCGNLLRWARYSRCSRPSSQRPCCTPCPYSCTQI